MSTNSKDEQSKGNGNLWKKETTPDYKNTGLLLPALTQVAILYKCLGADTTLIPCSNSVGSHTKDHVRGIKRKHTKCESTASATGWARESSKVLLVVFLGYFTFDKTCMCMYTYTYACRFICRPMNLLLSATA